VPFLKSNRQFPFRGRSMSNTHEVPNVCFRSAVWIGVLLAALVGLIYGRAAHAPFVHDDNISVLHNPSIVRLWPLFGTADRPGPLNPPRDAVTSGRPLVNLSFALNYYFGGYDTAGYHIVNIVLHALSSIVLYGILRRAMLLDCFEGRLATASTPLAAGTALVWAMHPLQTDAVEYVSQRTELMMGFCYLATLYGSLRYFTSEWPTSKAVAAVGATVACFAGMACKEVMVSAPVMVLLFDRTFQSGSFRVAIKKSWPLYAGLFGSWTLLLALNFHAPRSGAAGWHAGLPAYVWWFTQAKVVLLYLRLSIWPWPLIIHRETPLVWTLSASWPWVASALAAFAAAMILVWRRRAVGFLGVWFFAILSPTLVVPMPSEVVAERRMYLPLAAVVTLVIVGGFVALSRRRQFEHTANDPKAPRSSPLRPVLVASLVVTIVFCVVTNYRLEAYRDVITIWRDAVAYQPDNVRATINLGCALEDACQYQAAIEQFERAIEIDPTRPDVGLAHRSLGLTWASCNQPERAIHHLELAMQLRPDVARDHGTLGALLLTVHRFAESAPQLELAARQDPSDVLARANLATAYANIGRSSEAVAAARQAQALAVAQGETNWAAQLDRWLKAYGNPRKRR
jgi:protein O-mannosyl-transferase